jgi:predicted metal-dependent hydrolase
VLRLLLAGTSVGENRTTGEQSPTVRIIDFDERANNRFQAVCQFKVRILGTEHRIIPDIVLFLNGLPVVLAECKSPKVVVADSIRRLKELLQADTSDLVMAMIHKFRDEDLAETFPQLNDRPNILVMTDEAHRSQYKMLRANLDRAIPTATHIGYTGTPIDRTERVFGDYIDTYTMRQSIADGVTLEIVYEGRTHNAEVADRIGMDVAFADVFSEYNLRERLEILGHGSREAYMEADSTIAAKARDMIRHYLTHVFPNLFKAQIVTNSREAAVRYKSQVDAALAESLAELEQANPIGINLELLRRLQTDVIISQRQNDLPHLKEFTDASRQARSIKSFKMPFGKADQGVTGDMGVLIVNRMLFNGESALFLGRLYPITLTPEEGRDARFDDKFLIPASLHGETRNVLRAWYIAQAREHVLPRVRMYAEQLGVAYNEAKIVDNRYRWGSCTTKNNVNFNWRLIKAPMFVVDYVIVHELTHLLESNHTPSFWNIVHTQSPRMDKARQWLLENGGILEEEI